MERKVKFAGILTIATALAACSPNEVDQQAQQAWQRGVDAQKPSIAIIGNAPPPIVSNQLIDVVPVAYSVSDPGAVVDVRVNGGKPLILPNTDGEGKVVFVNVGSEGTHTLTISAKHCETSKEFGYHCSPEAFYQATIISDFTPPGAQVESLSIMADGKIQVNYRLADTNAQFGGSIKYNGSVTRFSEEGRATLTFDFNEKALKQVTVEVCDSVDNCKKESFTETLQDSTPPSLTLLNEKIVKGKRILTFQVTDDYHELLTVGGVIEIDGKKVKIESPDGIVSLSHTPVIGESIYTISSSDLSGNSTSKEASFFYNPFPTQVEMIQVDPNGTVRFRLVVNTEGDNFPANKVNVESTQKTGNFVLDTFPLFNRVTCEDPEVTSQHIDIVCKPLTPTGNFQFTLTGEAAGGETWKAEQVFTIQIPEASIPALTWYILRLGLAYGSVIAASGLTGSLYARRKEEKKRRKRVEEFTEDIIARRKPLEAFLEVHDKPNFSDLAIATVRNLARSKKDNRLHRLSKTERQTYDLIEKVWNYEYKKGDIYGAIIKLRCIDPFGYPSLERLKYEMITLLLSKVAKEFDEISENRYTQALSSHRIKQMKHLIKSLSTEKGFHKVREDVRIRLLNLVSEFDIVIRARSINSAEELFNSKELSSRSRDEKNMTHIFNSLINWNNIVIANDITRHVKNEKSKSYMRSLLKRTVNAIRSEFISELRQCDPEDLASKDRQKKLIRKYLQDMRLPKTLLEELSALLNLEVSRRNHDYVTMIRLFDSLVRVDNSLPLNETFVQTVEDAVTMISTDIEPFFASKSIVRLTPDMGTKILSFYAYLQGLQNSTWWDAIRFEKKFEIEQRVKELAHVIASGRKGLLEKMRPDVFMKGDDKEIMSIITLNAKWGNYAGVSNIIESTKDKCSNLTDSVAAQFHDNYWNPHVKNIVDHLQVENVQEAHEIAQASVYDFTQGVEVKSLLQNHKEYMYWKLKLLPLWPNLNLFPDPEHTQKEIASEVLSLVLNNKLPFKTALKAVEKWHEFTTLNAQPLAIFHYVGIQRNVIEEALKKGDIAPIAKALKLHLFNLSAHLQGIPKVSDRAGSINNEEVAAFYRISGPNLQYNWTLPLVRWLRSMTKTSPEIKANNLKLIPLSEDMEQEMLAESAIHNIFARLAQSGIQSYDNAVKALKLEPISEFVGKF